MLVQNFCFDSLIKYETNSQGPQRSTSWCFVYQCPRIIVLTIILLWLQKLFQHFWKYKYDFVLLRYCLSGLQNEITHTFSLYYKLKINVNTVLVILRENDATNTLNYKAISVILKLIIEVNTKRYFVFHFNANFHFHSRLFVRSHWIKELKEDDGLQSHIMSWAEQHNILIWRKLLKSWKCESAAIEILKKALISYQIFDKVLYVNCHQNWFNRLATNSSDRQTSK